MARFHGNIAPMGSNSASTTMNGVNAMLKNGGPTESLRPNVTSATSGQIVPTNTTNAATANRMLFITNRDSRLTTPKTPLAVRAPARAA